jgi:hypothetical protein
VQFARRLAEPRRHQNGCQLGPGNAFLPDGKQSLAHLLKAGSAPQGERQIRITKSPRALNSNALQAHRHCHMFAAVVKKLRLFGSADHMPRQRPRFNTTAFIEFAEMRHRLLNDATTDPHAAHQTPIAMNLSVLLASRVAQIHAANQNLTRRLRKIPLVATTRPNPVSAATQVLDLSEPPRQIDSPFGVQTAQVGLARRGQELGDLLAEAETSQQTRQN